MVLLYYDGEYLMFRGILPKVVVMTYFNVLLYALGDCDLGNTYT